ncbi:DNAase [Vibrio alginolyticus]|uniref:DNAase n=1 Tax=Vibrio alginolyticus TaxID=663 RepID=UPI001EECC18F|nr:DNAase [Vibrio alginolyticus]MCG6321580.1 DNAase [Vibrio alginolyticus]
MSFIKMCKDGFRGKPDFSDLLHNAFQIDDLVLSFECPNNIYEGHVYQDLVNLEQFDVESKIERHERFVKLATVYFLFQKKILNPLLPINKQGGLYIRLRVKSTGEDIDNISQLSSFLEREYYDFYHAPEQSEGSMRGYHTDLMKELTKRANKQWGEIPESEDRKREKEEYLIKGFLSGYPPIKCEIVEVGKNKYSKYSEGNLKYKSELRRVYNLPIKNEFYLSIEFWYKYESMFAKQKFLDWVRSADETFEKKVLELLDLSPLIDSYTAKAVKGLNEKTKAE